MALSRKIFLRFIGLERDVRRSRPQPSFADAFSIGEPGRVLVAAAGEPTYWLLITVSLYILTHGLYLLRTTHAHIHLSNVSGLVNILIPQLLFL